MHLNALERLQAERSVSSVLPRASVATIDRVVTQFAPVSCILPTAANTSLGSTVVDVVGWHRARLQPAQQARCIDGGTLPVLVPPGWLNWAQELACQQLCVMRRDGCAVTATAGGGMRLHITSVEQKRYHMKQHKRRRTPRYDA